MDLIRKTTMGFLLEQCLLVVMLLGVNVHARSLDPQLITLDEAKHYMDASATSDTHEFEIVSPVEVEETRQRRGAGDPLGLSQFKFRAFGEDFHLSVITNRQLTAKGMAVQYVDARGNVEERPLRVEHEACYKIGRVLSHDGASRVAVSTCNNGLSGIVKVEGFELFIRKLTANHTDSVRRRRRDVENPHIVYRRSAEDEGESGGEDQGDEQGEDQPQQSHFCGMDRYFNFEDVARGRLSPSHEDGDASTPGRRKREVTCSNGSPDGTKILELMVVADAEMNNYHGEDVVDYTLTLLNTVASSFMHESLGVTMIIKVVQLRVLQENYIEYGGNRVLNVAPDGHSTLTSFCRYQHYLNSANFNDPNHFDNAVLLTRYDLRRGNSDGLLGIAYYGGACSGDVSCALVEEMGFGSGLVLAHELGHNLGIDHDGETEHSTAAASCRDGVNIMSSIRTAGPDSFVWSSCSKAQLNTFLCHPISQCLTDNISGGGTRELDPSDKPGVSIDGQKQCNLIDPFTTGICRLHTDICGHLACMYSNGNCLGTGAAALDGTECAKHKWCIEGLCVDNPTPVNGGWSGWTTQRCSETCGQGTSLRTRVCNNPSPHNGGLDCPGSNTDSVPCNIQACPSGQPIDGNWSGWRYGVCSATCGDGFLEGSRDCNSPRPQNGGADCVGSGSIVYRCRQQNCPNVINGGWSGWSQGPCSKSCGGGTLTRTRTCDSPRPQNGGAQCSGNSQEVVGCNTQLCPVVVNGEWSSWSSGSCSETCGTGTQTRTRACNNPAPQNNGRYCPGSNTEHVSCENQACTVDGGWSAWQPFTSCSVTCGSGTRSRSRFCTNPAPSNGGQSCLGSNVDFQICIVTQTCRVDGGWSEWQPFTSCSVTCGTGRRTRTRTCTNPPPQNNGQSCPGSNIEYQNCNSGQACLTPINGGWSSWQSFGACSVTCGGGQQYRSRSCNSPAPQNGGRSCSGPSADSRTCNIQNCLYPINGGWSVWQPFGGCSVTCGRGQQSRSRSCTVPAPQNGGSTCTGPATETQACINADCPAQNPTGLVTGNFVGGVYQAYTGFLNIPVGAVDVFIRNRGTVTYMEVKDGDHFVISYDGYGLLPPRIITDVNHRGTELLHDYRGQETLAIAGPTTVALEVGVFLVLEQEKYGPGVAANITWSYRMQAQAQGQWVRTPGPCSVTCGTGFYVEDIRCATVSNGQQVFHEDESLCSHLTKPSPHSQTCNEDECRQETRWHADTVDCSGLCGEALGTRNVYCTSSVTWTVVPEAECDPREKPSTTAPCRGLPPCLPVQPTGSCQNHVVTTQGSISRMLTSTGGVSCGYTIVAPTGTVIRVQLVNYLIDCDNGEELVFKDGFRRADHCNRKVSLGTTEDSQTNVVQIEHKTTQSGHGYHIVYSFVYQSQPGACDENLLESPGTLQSPNYPNYYANDQTCRYLIVAPADMNIVLTFNELSLYNLCHERRGLQYDYIAFQDLEQNGSYGSLCGTSSNPTRAGYQSISNRLLITFRSDEQHNSRGFHASYTFVSRT